MKNGPFTLVVAALLRLDAQSMTVAARNLKEAGIMRTGARGVNAPEMTPRDLAVMLLAVLGTDKPAWSVDVVQRYGSFQLSDRSEPDAVASLLPDPDHTLLDFMSTICNPDLSLKPENEFVIRAVGRAFVEVKGGKWRLQYESRQEWSDLQAVYDPADKENLPPELAELLVNGPLSMHGLVTTREVQSETIQKIKTLVFSEGE